MKRALGVALLLGVLAGPVWAKCRQALVLGLDVSGSVDKREYRLQLDGLASALIDPDVQAAILAQTASPVYLAVYEWSGPQYQRILQGWTAVTNRQVLVEISAGLANMKRHPATPGTALGSAMRFGADMLANGPECWKRTLDISGDGKSNFGLHPRDVRQSLENSGLTLNALVIGVDTPATGAGRQVEIAELSAYFQAWVITGPDAFVETAIGFDDYRAAMTRKLLRELETLAVSSLDPAPVASPPRAVISQ
ncbi:MAG: hypothetical protein COC12_00515 [Rhodobacteraceae bacterium]|nr:MAG: hypothetical protein COC12_00515 [Paracoccaceae bacterium]